MKSTSKPNLVITFWTILLMISFESLILLFHLWVPNITIKKSNFNNTLLLLWGVWPKIMLLVYQSIFFHTLDCACSLRNNLFGALGWPPFCDKLKSCLTWHRYPKGVFYRPLNFSNECFKATFVCTSFCGIDCTSRKLCQKDPYQK